VVAFQRARGLAADGICDTTTWQALVEAGWALGDRSLYLRSPNLRGDDVAELQRQLSRMGFDPGRIDGIFGRDTGDALAEFQSNVDLRADGVCGAETVRALRRLGGRGTGGPSVSAVREYERLSRGERTLLGCRIVVGQLGGLANLARTVGRVLRLAGSQVLSIDDLDGSHHAAAANRYGADVYIGLVTTATEASIAYYATTGFESLGGRRLAELLHHELGAVLPEPLTPPAGMGLPVLRETRMPAVLVELGPPRPVLDQSPAVARAVVQALVAWVAAPVTRDRG
jgi:N-acetylmuramoyl-L-alanine amidase